jgi:Zn-dependent peptidase ImmA (M78 family)
MRIGRLINMSQYITSQNLNEVIEANKKIRNEIENFKSDFFINYNKIGITGFDKLAFEVLKKNYNLIQLPIDDEYWGGAIFIRNNFKIPVINSAQPRVYQFFVAWHEIFHLLYDNSIAEGQHNIKAEKMELNERKADYFAARMLLGDVYGYYYSLENDEFINKIARCMDVFKAPYKAVLIQLYEDAVDVFNDIGLKRLIIENFDKKPENLVELFENLELDTDLVKPSNIISFGGLDKKIELLSKKEPDVDYHRDNLKFLNKLKDLMKGELNNGNNSGREIH